ncbi:hypothetical protein PV327_007751 [Microctonus hyperodae]|uniref:Uncharacterized protein n=1 Tax=Microctonus hyperodae TaxID=165561 RepID=A0AA39G096_MICHY|nr:hypothetical protein PV327_007751 [Microctonus hyperodae]
MKSSLDSGRRAWWSCREGVNRGREHSGVSPLALAISRRENKGKISNENERANIIVVKLFGPDDVDDDDDDDDADDDDDDDDLKEIYLCMIEYKYTDNFE